jgi:hypothetical protein
MRSAIHSPVLVLNASYEPLHVCAARRALTLIVKDAAHVQEHAGREVHAGIMFPTVIRLKAYRKVPHRVQVLTRRNILVSRWLSVPVLREDPLCDGVDSRPCDSTVKRWTVDLGESGRVLLCR